VEEAGRLGCVDASVCIALESIGKLDLLPGLFSRVLVSEGVLAELMKGTRRDDAWLVIRNERTDLVLAREIVIPTLPNELHRGEREVIGLSMQRRAIALLDDARARKAARALGVQVHGTLGLLLAGKASGQVELLRPLLLDLLDRGFHLDHDLVARALDAAGEA
jgi:predicted nucleic acid-binding protein